MTGVYDEMSERSYPTTRAARPSSAPPRPPARRDGEAGLHVFESEWWHFDYKDWKSYAIQNVPFERIR